MNAIRKHLGLYISLMCRSDSEEDFRNHLDYSSSLCPDILLLHAST